MHSQPDKYIIDHIDPEDELLRELERETNLKVLNSRMLSGHLQGHVLTILSGTAKCISLPPPQPILSHWE